MDSLTWKNVKIDYCNKRSINIFNRKLRLSKSVLKNVKGTAVENQVLAIFGQGNSGKTVLLDYLSNTLNRGFTGTGKRYLPAVEIDDLDNHIGYVTQDESFHPHITLYEHLKYYGTLRGNGAPLSLIEENVLKVIGDLQLDEVKNEFLFTENSSQQALSSVQLKLVALAIELLKSPKVLLLDDFFRDIDVFNGSRIMQYLRSYNKMIIICTFNDIDSPLFLQCDSYLLIDDGRTSCQLTAPDFKKIVMSDEFESLKNIQHIGKLYTYIKEKSEDFVQMKLNNSEILNSSDYDDLNEGSNIKSIIKMNPFNLLGQKNSPLYIQLMVLVTIMFKGYVRKPLAIITRIYQEIAIAVFLVLAYYGIKYDSRGVEHQGPILFLLCGIVSLNAVISSAMTTPPELKRFSNEFRHKIYSPWIYMLAKTIAEIPIGSLQILIFTLITYFGLSLRPEPASFIIHYILLAISYQNGLSFGILVSTFYGDALVGMCFLTPLMAPLLAMSSFIVKEKSISIYIRWAKFISWFPYLFESLIMLNFKDAQIPCGPYRICRKKFINGNKYVKEYVMRPYLYYGNIFIIIGLGLGFRFLSAFCIFLSVKFRNKKNPYSE